MGRAGITFFDVEKAVISSQEKDLLNKSLMTAEDKSERLRQ